LDRLGANDDVVIEQMKKRLGLHVAACQMPSNQLKNSKCEKLVTKMRSKELLISLKEKQCISQEPVGKSKTNLNFFQVRKLSTKKFQKIMFKKWKKKEKR
jgi:translation elongation factor EF-G